MASSFEEEILEWTLDQDAVQTLLGQGTSTWGLTREEAMNKIVGFGRKGYLGFYESAPDKAGYLDIPTDHISLQYIDDHVYTWLSVTQKTMQHLNVLRRMLK